MFFMNFWMWFAVAGIGFLLGTATYALRNDGIDFPNKENGKWKLGFLLDAFWGLVGSFSVVFAFLLAPQGNIAIMLYAIIGGLGGRAAVMSIVRRFNDALDNKAAELLESELKPKDEGKRDPNND